MLGHVASKEGIRMNNERIAAVDAMTLPRSARELRRYLGCVNNMRRHVKDAAILMKPLSSQVNVPVAEWPLEDVKRHEGAITFMTFKLWANYCSISRCQCVRSWRVHWE